MEPGGGCRSGDRGGYIMLGRRVKGMLSCVCVCVRAGVCGVDQVDGALLSSASKLEDRKSWVRMGAALINPPTSTQSADQQVKATTQPN